MAGLVEAASELESIARHLRRAGELDLVRELNAAMRRGVQPVPQAIRAGLKPKLPDRYAETLDADLALGISVRTSDRNPGVSVTAKARAKTRKLKYLDAGRLTHPVFGDREVWRTQELPSVQPHWFTGPVTDAAPRIRGELERALEDVAAKASGKGA
jgi:hypothetical protein